MLDVRFVCENMDLVEERLKLRGKQIDLTEIKKLANERLELLYTYETNQQLLNKSQNEMANLDKKSEEFAKKRDELKEISEQSKKAKTRLAEVLESLDKLILYIPNLPQESVPVGASEEDNVIIKTWGVKPSFNFTPKNHWDLGDTDYMDFERGSKITGTKFTVMKSYAAKMERALINLMLDTHGEAGYTEIFPPFLVNRTSMTGTGQLPKFEEDAFKIEGTDYFLVPTAEVPVTNLFADEIIPESELPIKYAAYTACFRKEAGSAGRDTRGLIRQHQFNKVELVKITTPETSDLEHKKLLEDAERILQKLNLHYRVVELCGADLGFSASKCFDIEVWLPGQDNYREISSVSNFLDFQARRAKIRYKSESEKKNSLAHTINGSGLAVGRTVVAIFENYQQEDGSIIVPEVLRPYMGGLEIIPSIVK
ncbi:serine--tRNA ligase [bacterium]|nr:serine--tRNA ligase [bacterium]